MNKKIELEFKNVKLKNYNSMYSIIIVIISTMMLSVILFDLQREALSQSPDMFNPPQYSGTPEQQLDQMLCSLDVSGQLCGNNAVSPPLINNNQQSSTLSAPQWMSYVSPQTGMSLQYPSAWRIVYEDELGVELSSPDNFFKIGVERIPPGYNHLYPSSNTPITEIIDRYIQFQQTNMPNFQFVSKGVFDTGYDGYYIFKKGNHFSIVNLSVVSNGELYRNYITGIDEPTIIKYRPLGEKILSTVTFNTASQTDYSGMALDMEAFNNKMQTWDNNLEIHQQNMDAINENHQFLSEQDPY